MQSSSSLLCFALVCSSDSSDFLALWAPVCCTFSFPALEIPCLTSVLCSPLPWIQYSPSSWGSFTLPPAQTGSCAFGLPLQVNTGSSFFYLPKRVNSSPYLPPKQFSLWDTCGELSHAGKCCLSVPLPLFHKCVCLFFFCLLVVGGFFPTFIPLWGCGLYSPYVSLKYDGVREWSLSTK